MAKKVLVVDDEKLIVKGIRFSLEQDGMEVDCAYDGEEALSMAKEKEYDMILLDLMLPKLDGLSVCQQIREFSNVPIVMLTAKGEDMDKILGLEYGADDYITKPFSLAVLRARINTQLRNRTAQMQKESAKNTQIWEGSIWKFDFTNMRFTVSGQEVELSKTEQKLLALLVQHVGMTVPRETLMDRIWTDGAVYVDENALSVAIKRLRDKLQAKEQIRTVYGIGYVWEV